MDTDTKERAKGKYVFDIMVYKVENSINLWKNFGDILKKPLTSVISDNEHWCSSENM